MATSPNPDQEQIRIQRELNAAVARAVSSMRQFEKAAEGASSAAIDKVTPALIAAAKNTSLLSDELKEEIKTFKGAAKALDEISKRMGAVKDLEKAFKEGKRTAHGVSTELSALGISLEAGATVNDRVTKTLAKLAAESEAAAAAQQAATRVLSSSSVKLAKEFEGMRSRVIENVASFGTLGTTVKLASKAITQFYDIGIDLASKGMLGAAAQLTIAAPKLGLLVSEISELAGKNRGIINSLGGGTVGMEKFFNTVAEGRKGLEIFGKDSSKIYAGFLDVLNKNGAGFGNTKTKEDTIKYADQLKNQFREMSALFGDTADGFTGYYDQLLQSEGMQARLNSLDAEAIRLTMQDNIQSTRQLRLLGLTTEQLTTMNKTLEAQYNPNKNRQSETIKEAFTAKQSLLLSARDAGSTNPLEAQRMLNGGAEQLQKFFLASAQQKEKMRADPAMVQAFKDAAVLASARATARENDTGSLGAGASFKGMGSVMLRDQAGTNLDIAEKIGNDLLSAKRAGLDKNNIQDVRDSNLLQNGLVTGKNGNVEATAAAKAFGDLRMAIDTTVATFNNPLAIALTAIIAAFVTTSGAAGKLGRALTAAAAAAGLGKGTGVDLPGAKGGKWGKAWGALKGMGKFALKGGAGALASYGLNKVAESQGKDNAVGAGADIMSDMVAGTTIGSMIAPGIGTGIGAVAGGAYGLYKNWGTLYGSDEKKQQKSVAPIIHKNPTSSGTISDPSNVKGWSTARPEVQSAILNASASSGISASLLAGMAAKESSLGKNTRASSSSASGTFQFIDSTWLDMIKKYGKGVGLNTSSMTRGEILSLRSNEQISALMAAAYIKENQAQTGDTSAGGAYLAHFLGGGTAKRVLNADPSTPISSLISPGAIAANPGVFRGISTAGDLKNWSASSMAKLGVGSDLNSSPITGAIEQKTALNNLPGVTASTISIDKPQDKLLTESEKQTALLASIASSMTRQRAHPEAYQADQQTTSSL